MKRLATSIGIIGIITTLLLPAVSFAQNIYNLGTLNLQLSNGQEEISLSGQPGQSFEESISISNHSNTKTSLQIYSSDAKTDGKNYLPSNQSDPLFDEGTWNKLPFETLILQPGQTNLYKFNIKFPENAGVGEHYGAIMFKYRDIAPGGNIINFEKGLRISAKVLGNPITKYELINPVVQDKNNLLTYKTTLYNSGNTDLKGEVKLTTQDSETGKTSPVIKVFVTPGQEQEVSLSLAKPDFGPSTLLSKININNDLKTFVLKEDFYLPGALFPLFLILGIFLISFVYLNTKNLSPAHKSILSALVGIVGTASILGLAALKDNLLADVLFQPSDTGYITTVKWGNFQKMNLYNPTITFWKGNLKASSGRLIIVEKLNIEKSDHLSLDSAGQTLNFQNITGPDNDGVVLLFKPSAEDLNPTITYTNELTGEEKSVLLVDTIKEDKLIPYKGSFIKISSDIAEDKVTLKAEAQNTLINTKDLSTSTTEAPIIEVQSTSDVTPVITDNQSTADIGAANSETPAQPERTPTPQENVALQNEITTLREIIKDLPSSADVLSQYILNSSYVDQVTTENNSTTVDANPMLISKLKNAPNTIKEMTGTADSSFIFIPNSKVQLSPQPFSFQEDKSSSQELGEIVFVQNKRSPWNTYLSITDFTSVSGKDNIPAGKVVITPGPIKVVSQNGDAAEITAGDRHEITNQNDQATLVTVVPHGDGETIFSIKPQISLQIPAGTPPGIYRAEISIKEI